jgi:hypothetical protein
MTSICCTPPSPDYNSLLPEEKQKFGFLVHQMRKKGFDLKTAEERAYTSNTGTVVN